jgi:hypothetical protein
LGLAGEVGVVSAQTSFEAAAFSDPNLIAAIFAPPPSKQTSVPSPQDLNDRLGFPSSRKEFHARTVLPPIPEDWEAFDKQFAPHQHPGQPSLQLLENGFYEFNQTIYSIKLFERKVNSLLNFEYSLRELGAYDSRSKENAIDNVFDHAAMKTDFNWDAPIGLFVGVRFQLKCDSIFQFWK